MALFCDFENIALGVEEAHYPKFDLTKVMERLLLKGSIVVKKAYCDWNRYKEFKSGVLKRLGDSERGYVAEILRHARMIAERAPNDEAPGACVEAIDSSAQKIEGILRHDFWTRAEEALQGRSILVVSAVRKSRRILVRALIGTAYGFDPANLGDDDGLGGW